MFGPRSLVAVTLAAACAVAGCGDDGGDEAGRTRADQAVEAARQAGLADDIAEVLGLAARGATATYTATYVTDDGSDIVIHQDGADRRIDLRAGESETSVSLVRDGQAFACTVDADGALESCTKTDAVVDPPGSFDPRAVEELIAALAAGVEDFDIAVVEMTVASTDASCLRTSRKPESDDPLLAQEAIFCVSDRGVPLLIEQGDQRLEATAYQTSVDRQVFELPLPG